ncbi:LacI family DNA-binding transcriptional regulator [Bacillus sp. V33-4]|uniref:LacI family DNA-binding transcriptional regulator n=1 Tax=Bacillus sp. V33-4 TaxID=2054169 RepID=UPI000C78D4F8|nr:LacI family DNA-binding transcriptional regulator [Bacillus sp. V33-4]PLR84874.1 LacI family transcriptional regulator [Bacillus sp. V33-4]
MITINAIAERAGVSRTTVSRVLNSSGYVSEEARKRVLAVIEETGYVPNEYAKSLRTKKTKVVGVVLPKISTETASRLVDGIDKILADEGYQILLTNTNLEPEKEIEYLKLLKSRNVDGVILSATNINDELLKEIENLNIPFVAVGQEIPDVSTVVFDDFYAAKEMAELLINRGHQKIAFIGVDPADRSVGHSRKDGYLAALKEHDLPIVDDWQQTGIFDVESGYKAMKTILEKATERPTAVLAVTDRLAVGAMQYLKESGYRIPENIAVAGMGASEMSKYVSPSLTTMDFNYERAGEEAARQILNKINRPGEEKEKKIVLNYRIIKRNSI